MSAERALRIATTVAARNTVQHAAQEAKFVLLNNPPFRAWNSDAAYCWTKKPQVNTPSAISATEAANNTDGALNQKRRSFDKSVRRMASRRHTALKISPTIIRTNVTEPKLQRVDRAGQ